MGGLKFVSMKWKTTPVSSDNSSSEEEPVPGTSGIDTTNPADENIQSIYNLRPRKPIDTSHDSIPEPEGYNLHSHDKNHHQRQLKSPQGKFKPKPKPAKPGKVVFQSYGLTRPRPHVRKFNCIICSKTFDTQGSCVFTDFLEST